MHLRGTITEAISIAAIGVRNFPIFFRIFRKSRTKEKESLFPVFSYSLRFLYSAYEYTRNARMIVRQDANGKFNCVPEPRYIFEYLPTSAEER